MDVSRAACLGALLVLAFLAGVNAHAQQSTECSRNVFCYCVHDDLKKAISARVDEVRARIAAQRAQGKAIGYLSIPISTVAGSYFGVNAKVAARTKERVEDRFGVRSLWLLNTAAKEFSLPGSASGADYMLMWTRILEGEDGLGRDFDVIYFAGPSDFAEFFSFDGRSDLEKLEQYYDGLRKTETGLATVNRTEFRNYYGLRASVSFSLGSHDEWNIVRKINERRKEEKDGQDGFGVARQVALMFNGSSVAPGLFEATTASGNESQCPLPRQTTTEKK
ncbi:hypothetical protein [Bradyrhizobium sp. NBAIM08]|uniref:hypothetical protein n=1 Tax=Bradyrhizobium sp. NBAIM08 TaxID=2793815 RepID=UPI001CD335F2|nr:hypothetical protein [Bradyrhizobium sp. NBAIM08]